VPGRRRFRTLGLAVAGLLVVALVTRSGSARPVLVIPSSESVPWGIYWVSYGAEWQRGSLVVFRPPAVALELWPRTDSAASVLWMKRVAAGAGDMVCATEDGLWVNGVRANGVAPPAKVPTRPALRGCERLPSGTVYLTGNGPRSLDSRYWGPVDAGQVVAPAALIL
jgi:type IV secretory pathway protease TraF